MTQTIRGGGHVGANWWLGYRVSWPLASLSISPDSITLSMWPVRYRFDRSSIEVLLRKRVLGWPSLFIVHTNPALARSVVFQPFRFSVLESVLAENGYHVTTREPDESLTRSIEYSNSVVVISCIAAMAGIIAAVVAGFIGWRAAS